MRIAIFTIGRPCFLMKVVRCFVIGITKSQKQHRLICDTIDNDRVSQAFVKHFVQSSQDHEKGAHPGAQTLKGFRARKPLNSKFAKHILGLPASGEFELQVFRAVIRECGYHE